MIGTGIDVRVKIQDIVSSQLPSFILSEAPLTDDFLKQFYVSQEFQGGPIDFATNLDQYLDLNNLSTESIYGQFELTQVVSIDDDVVYVNTTKSFPNEWGLLKVNDEIMTYTGITTNSFTGVVRGFSGVTSLHAEGAPEELVFTTTEASAHLSGASVTNLSTLFLKEFYKKLTYTFAPGFEDLDVDAELDVGNWIRQVRSFFQTKGSEESIIILFKVLYGEKPTVIDLENFLIKPSTAEYSRRDYAVGIPVEGNPIELKGKSIFQVDSPTVFGAVSEIEAFTRDGRLYYRIYFFVSNEEVSNERKLFTIPGRSYCQREWNPGDTTLTVDTTIGFRDNGEFITADGVVFNYEQRSVNQFLGVTCSDPLKSVSITDEIIDNVVVSGKNDAGEEITLRLTGVISDIDFGDEVPFNFIGEKIRVDTLGQNIQSSIATRRESTVPEIIANSFVYNTSVRFEVLSVNGTSFILAAPYLDKSSIASGDRVDILPRGGQIAYVTDRLVTEVDFVNSTITIDDSFGVPVDQSLDVRRNQKYANSTGAPIDYGNNSVLTNVLNLYDAREYDSNYYVATNSLPSYEISADIVESSLVNPTIESFESYNSFTGEFSTIVFGSIVNFYTGDLITYSVSEGTTPLIDPGEYYVQVLSDKRKIQLFVSPSFIGLDSTNFVGIVSNDDDGSHFFTLEQQKTRQISTKRTFRKIPVSDTLTSIDREPEETKPGAIAVLTNGVEIISYKSPNKVYLGPLKELDAASAGEGYSVVTPPQIYIADPDIQLYEGGTGSIVPTTAKGTPAIKGRLEEILIDPQDFDIDEVFSITVKGGNSRGASAIPVVDKKNRSLAFDTRITDIGGGINPTDDSILFTVAHNITEGTPLIYNNRGADSIGVTTSSNTEFSTGTRLSNGGIYYPKILNNRTIQLFETKEALTSGGNPVFLSANLTGYGIQSFDTERSDRLIGATITDDGGDFFYRNMKFYPENVFIEYDEIRYISHGFESGDLVEYGTTGVAIGGMSTDHQYYVYKIDDNVIKLSDAGIGATISSNYDRLDFVDLTSTGIGTHNIKYPDVVAEVTASFTGGVTGTIIASPIVRGSIEQVYTDDGGYYGSDIINFEKNPEVYPIGGSLANLSPSIINGIVNFVQIVNKGKNYSDCPELVVTDNSGFGVGAKLRAVVVDGEIVDVIIINGGIGYDDTSFIQVVETGRDALIIPRIRDLTINLDARFGFEILNQNNYRIVSYNRVLREEVYSDIGNFHSPIIGWANDGNPIYGGFAFSDPQDTNSEIRAMKSAYTLAPADVYGRPSQTAYPAGFFIEDYKYVDEGDLDEYNGRYCRTPDFPNGVYAYFASISTDPQSNAREAQFPYFIGPKFRDSSIDSGNTNVDQSFNLNDKPIYRNTFPYYVGSPVAGSEFIDQSYLFDIQDSIVETTSPGSIDGIDIVGAGKSYSVGDIPIFDTSQDFINCVVSQVTGYGVSSIQEDILSYSKLDTKLIRIDQKTVRVYVYPSHDYRQNDSVIVSGLSTSTSSIVGSRVVSTDNSAMTLYSPVEPVVNEGVTDIFVNSISNNVSIGSSLQIGIGVSAENVTVLNIFPINKAIRVFRPVSFPFTAQIGDSVTPAQNFFDINVRTPEFESTLDTEYYFNPKQVLGIGLTLGQDIERVYQIGNIDYPISIPTASIYAPSHDFINLEEVTFKKPPTGDPLVAETPDNVLTNIPTIGDEQTLYVHVISKDLIGLRLSPNEGDLRFTSDGSDLFQYLISTNRFAETANLDRIRGKVTTTEPHQLQNGDTVSIDVLPFGTSGVGTNPAVIVEFDDVSQSLIIDPKFASPGAIDITLSLVFIENHNYILGDYLLYENNNIPISGLIDHQKYFVIPFDTDRFYLAETEVDIKIGSENPITFSSTGTGEHKFSKVNPQINIVSNHDILFDVQSPTLQNRELKFFYDQALTEVFENNGIDPVFVVSGVSTEGTKTIRYSPNNPGVIYYGIESGGYISTTDTNAISYNTISNVNSVYSIKGTITVDDDSIFSLSLPKKPEVPSYEPDEASLSYLTSSKNTVGGVGEVRIISVGNNYDSLPEFITIQSSGGSNASLRARSQNIGRLSSFRIQNPGWAYSADKTISPSGIIQPSIQFTDSDFVTDVVVLDGGIGYQSAPEAVLVDSVTRETINTGSLIVETQSSKVISVETDVSPSGLSKNLHELYTINNSNGIPIINIVGIDSTRNEVIYSLQTPITGYAVPPFAIGDKVFVENVFSSEGTPSELNSSEYGYEFFDVVSVVSSNPIIITVKYPDSAEMYDGMGAAFQGAFSSLVNKNIYPVFQVNQTTAVFIDGERLSIITNGNSQQTDLIIEESNTNFFKVSGNFDILPGDSVRGNISGIEATITTIDKSFCRYEVSSVSRNSIGWRDSIGFINDEFQVTPDNDYYQNLSYSIKSSINFETLIGPVNRLVHPAGLKNFADTRIDSIGFVGFGTTAINTDSSITIDLIGLTDVAETPLRVDRINVFDLGYDSNIIDNKTNEIRFNSFTAAKRLTDYIEVKTNRVLLADDISDQFIDSDNLRRQNNFIEFDVITDVYTRGIIQVRNPFTDQVQLSEIISLTYDNNAFTMSKADVFDGNVPHGIFESKSLPGGEYSLRFTPTDPDIFDMNLKLLTQKFDVNSLGAKELGFVTLGGLSGIVPALSSRYQVYVAPTDVKAVALQVFVQTASGLPSYYEVYAFILDGQPKPYYSTYSFDGIPVIDANGIGFDFTADFIAGRLRVYVNNTNDSILSFKTKELEFEPISSGENPYRFKNPNIPNGSERGLHLLSDQSSGSTNDSSIDVLTLESNLFSSYKVVVFIKGTTIGAIHQVMVASSDGSTYTNTYPFITEGDGDGGSGIGTFGAELNGLDWTLKFYPDNSFTPQTLTFTSYAEAFFTEYDAQNYDPTPLVYQNNQEAYYLDLYNAALGERTDVKRFPIKYQGIPVYEKQINPPDSINLSNNIITINNHFFSDIEEIYYTPDDSVFPELAEPVGIGITVDYLGVSTDKMPEKVWVIKLGLNTFQVAATKADAEVGSFIDILDYGVGNSHRFGMEKKLEKSLFTIDGIVQSPIASTNLVYELDSPTTNDDLFLQLVGISTITPGDLLLIDEEYVLINDVGFSTQLTGPISNTGSFPLVEVERGAVGSLSTSHSSSTPAYLYRGSYDIVETDIVFTQAPNGSGPQQPNLSNIVVTNSEFQGRIFLQKNYDKTAVFDDISSQFDGTTNQFTLTTGGITTGGVENGSGVMIINDVYQTPTTSNNQGNNYFFTNAQSTFAYQWSDDNDTSNCIDGEIRFSIANDEVGFSNLDSNGIGRSDYFKTLNDGESYEINVNYGSSEFTYEGNFQDVLDTTKFVGGSITDGVVPTTIDGLAVSITILPVQPQNNVIYTGVTSSNGRRVESQFDVNQNQIPRGGLIVSLGSTPGLGYAPLYDAILEPEVVGGEIVGVFTSNTIGDTTPVRWATYDNDTGELIVSLYGNATTAQEPVSGATYFKESGRLLVNTPASLSGLGVRIGDIVTLDSLLFSCTSGGAPSQQLFPDQDSVFIVEEVITENIFSVTVGISTLDHTYVAGGIWQKVLPFEFGRQANNPNFVYLDKLEFECPSGQTAGLTTTLFPTDTDNYPVITRDDDAHLRIQVGLSTLVHNYVGGGTIGQITKNSVGSGYNSIVSIGITEVGHTGAGASIRGIPGPGGELQIVIDDPGSGYVDPYIWAPSPNYFNLPIRGISRRDGSTDTGKNLFVTCEVGGSKTTAIGRSEYFEVTGFEISNQGYGFLEGDVVTVVGLVTDKSLSSPIEDFELTVLDTFTDNFSYWNYGQQDYIDSIASLQDGVRTRFPLIYNGEEFSFEKNPTDEDSESIDLNSILLIYVNTVLQVPGVSYNFNGGTSFEFTQPPLPKDDIDIYFYRGDRENDSTLITSVNQTIKPGDDLQITKNNAYNPDSRTQNIRLVTEIASSDTVRTTTYSGAGDLDSVTPRPVAWDKQKRDIFIYGQPTYKTRDSLESIIKPDVAIIAPINPSSTVFYVDSPQLFRYESDEGGEDISQLAGRIYSQDDVFINSNEKFEEAVVDAVVNSSGQVTGLNVINPGRGYPTDTSITIGISTGDRARVSIYGFSSFDGSLQFAIILPGDYGSLYDPANPPTVLIEQPSIDYESTIGINGNNVRGYSSQITSISPLFNPIPGVPFGLRFTLNKLNDNPPITDLKAGDYVAANQTNIGSGVVAVGVNQLDVVGVGTQFLDSIYKVQAVDYISTNVVEIDVNVTTNVSGLSSTGQLGYVNFGVISSVTRDPLIARGFDIPDPIYTPDMSNFPTLVRTKGGLRDQGGIAKVV